ncbi:Chromo domain-like [Phytophthora cactorum]|nr:Chromo domain-like [Phytophthora cactorum]
MHVLRLNVCEDKDLRVTEETLQHVALQGIVLKVASIRDHLWSDRANNYELLMRWHGLKKIDDLWEPMQAIRKDIQLMVETYANQTSDADFTTAVMLR